MDKIIADVPGAGDWKTIRKIEEGWSDDIKYFVEDEVGRRFLLRISNGNKYEEEHQLYEALRDLNKTEILTSKLIDSGLCNDGKNTFRIFDWLEGQEMTRILSNFSDRDQYSLGYSSGQILRNIHEVKSPTNWMSWDTYYNRKISRKIALYRSCSINFPHSNQVINYIQEHKSLLKGRPQRLLHGDYHVGNFLLTPDQELAVIDFNRLDFGDPWEEFNRIIWTASQSVSFAKGQINGYFREGVPEDFFKLLAVYIGVNLIGSIPWAIPYGDEELQTILKLCDEVMEWYDNFDLSIPTWYSM